MWKLHWFWFLLCKTFESGKRTQLLTLWPSSIFSFLSQMVLAVLCLILFCFCQAWFNHWEVLITWKFYHCAYFFMASAILEQQNEFASTKWFFSHSKPFSWSLPSRIKIRLNTLCHSSHNAISKILHHPGHFPMNIYVC